MSINVYKFPVSSDIISTYNIPGQQGLFDTGNNMFCLAHDIDGLDIEPREKRELHPGVAQDYVTTHIKNSPITITTKDGRECIKWIFEAIEEINGLFFELHDYVHPERRDREQGYTIRNVIKESIKPVGGTGVTGDSIIAGLGWRINLIESVRQFY